MPSRCRALMRRPPWLIISYQNDRLEVLTIDLGVEGCVLPVFSFEEEAQAFLHLLFNDEEEKEWRSERTESRGLVSILLGPCADIERVALDPLPLPMGRVMLPLVSMNWDTFLRYLLAIPIRRSCSSGR
jgi:hypothetical protein